MTDIFNKSFTDGKRRISNLGVSRHKAVHVVVDLLEYEASVHEGEAALWKSSMDLFFAFQSEILAQNLHSQRCDVLMLYLKPKSILLRVKYFKLYRERCQPWRILPSCGWRCELRPGCPCTSGWCAASAYSPESPPHGRRMQRNAGSWTAGLKKIEES